MFIGTRHYLVIAALGLATSSLSLSAQKPPKPGGTAANPAIAYEARTRNGYWDLMVMNADGTNQTRLVNGGDNTTPSWSPDGEWIAFSRSRVASPGIYILRRNGTGLCRVASTTGLLTLGSPAWSPRPIANGLYKIVYADQSAGGSTDLFAVDAVCGGSASQRISTAQTPGGFGPAWSQNDVLAIGRGLSGLWVHDILLDAAGNITLGPGLELTGSGPLSGKGIWTATWTEDGTQLIVPASFQSNADLWVVSAIEPGMAAQLTDTPSISESRISWSPDFTRFVFDENSASISKVTADNVQGVWTLGARVTLASLTRTSPGGARPSWRPVP